MSGIVLSASVRQNLLSLQSTASLLATTQNDLATGNKVNSALDNPTNFFTAAGLNNRASDIGNLLDSIGNGVQVLQAANTGITSLQSLVASAQSIANQVLQSPVGYSTKSNVTSTRDHRCNRQQPARPAPRLVTDCVRPAPPSISPDTATAITGTTALAPTTNSVTLARRTQRFELYRRRQEHHLQHLADLCDHATPPAATLTIGIGTGRHADRWLPS